MTFLLLGGDQHIAFEDRLGVIVHLMSFDVRHLAVQVEFTNEIRFAVVEVNGFGIDQLGRADFVHVSDHLKALFQHVPGRRAGFRLIFSLSRRQSVTWQAIGHAGWTLFAHQHNTERVVAHVAQAELLSRILAA